MNNFDKNLENLSINNLRERARKVGISTPTIFSKKVLIQKIINNEEKYNSDRGRPFVYDEDTIGFISHHIDEDLQYELPSNRCIGVLNSDDTIKSLVPNEKIPQKAKPKFNTEGYIYRDESGIYLLDNNLSNKDKCIPIPGYVISDIFKIGDYIKAICIDTPDGKVANQIYCDELQFDRDSYSSIQRLASTKKSVKIENYGQILLGSRNIFLSNGSISFDELLKSLRKSTSRSVISLSISVMPEKAVSFTKNDFFTLNGDSEDNILRAINLFCQRARRLVESGNDVMLILNDLLPMYLNLYSSPKIRQSFLNLFNYVGFYENKSVVTLLSFASKDFVKEDVMLREWLYSMDANLIELK